MDKIRKAIIPAAGYGTRFLPVTKAVPKEMLPIFDTPCIEYTVEECVESGITDICILYARGKNAIPDYFDRNTELENQLKHVNKTNELPFINKYIGKVNFTYIRQAEMKGTGKALELCRTFVGRDAFAVLFPDDVIYNPEIPAIGQLINAYEKTGSSIIGVQETAPELAVNYGVIVAGQVKGRYVEVRGFKEKPKIDEVCSPYTSYGRFVLTPEIFDAIEVTPAVKSGETHLTSAIGILAETRPVYAYNFEGKHYDTGNKVGYVIANVEYALRDKSMSEAVRNYLVNLAANDYKV